MARQYPHFSLSLTSQSFVFRSPGGGFGIGMTSVRATSKACHRIGIFAAGGMWQLRFESFVARDPGSQKRFCLAKSILSNEDETEQNTSVGWRPIVRSACLQHRQRFAQERLRFLHVTH